MVKVSIVTVVYNGAATLERTIRSVLEQDHPFIEYIIMDGGSTDGTVDIIRRYADRLGHWESAPDKGIYDAMNKGIARCTGDLVGLINADDWYEPGVIGRVVRESLMHPHVPIFHGDINLVFPDGQRKLKRAKRSAFLLKYWELVFNHPSYFVRREFYEDHPYSLDFPVNSDHHWTLKAYYEDPANFHYIPEPIANFSIGGASTVIPLKKGLAERRRMARSLGLGTFETLLCQVVKAVLYIPQHLKLRYNEWAAGRGPAST